MRLTLLCAALLTAATLHGQNRGQADLAFQGYYLGASSQTLNSTTGSAIRFQDLIPNLGILAGSFEGYGAQNGIQTGDNFLQLRGTPWLGYRWNITGGDFRAPGLLLESPFNNIFTPEIAARGFKIQATHGDTDYTFFVGEETVGAGPRVSYRILAPQTVIGASVVRRVGKNLRIGGRFMEFSSSLQAIADNPNLFPTGLNFSKVSTASMQALYTPLKRLKLYGELSHSRESKVMSSVAGFAWEARSLTVRANYVAQGALYFPLVGYFTGDRRGPFGEVRLRPWKPLELYGSASQYRNNLENDANATSLRSSSVSGGLNAWLPWKFSLNGQISLVGLISQAPGSAVTPSDNRLLSALVSRSIGHHSLQVNWRDFKLVVPSLLQRQSSTEILDTYQVGHLSLGAAARMQQATGSGQGDSVYIRGSVQANAGRFSIFANLDYGDDLVSRTVFATNTYNTTVVGFGMKLSRAWNLHAEMFRNRLATDLNPESIFILEGAGAPVSQNLAGLNQRSLYFSLTKQLRWGGGLPTESMDQSAAIAAPLVGTVEGVVRARTLSGAALAAGIPITLDGHHTVMTGFDGHYLFSGVPEGAHEVSLSTAELPAEFDPGEPTKAVVSIQPRRAARADFEVLPLSTIEGTVTGPQGSNLDGFVIRLRPGKRYTLTRSEGRFSFYNVREGDFQLVIDTATLPPNAKLLSGPSIPVSVRAGTAVPSVAFSIDTTSSPPKAIRSVLQKEYATPIHSEIEPLPDTEKPVRGASDGIAKPVVPVSHKLSDPTASEPAAVSHKLINHWASVPAAVPHKTSDPPPPVPEPVSQRVSDPAAPVPAPLSHKVINPRASAPAAASESHPYFAVAAGMFRNPEYARSMRTAMGEKFGAVRIVPLNSGGELWCVLVGNAVSQAEAQALASKVRQSNTSLRSAYVVRIDSLSPAAFTKVAPRTSAPASRPFFYDPAAPVVNDRCGVSVRHHTRSCTAVSRGPS